MTHTHYISEEEIQRRAEEVFAVMKPRCTDEEYALMRDAYNLAHEAHSAQKRKTGEPYIVHPIAVARICAEELHLDVEPVCAAFLHDVVEDTPITDADIKERFGADIAFLVRVVTKKKKKSYNMSKQLDNFKQMLDSMHYDIRAILIKLADRLHNMRTLDSMAPSKQMKIAGETDYFYAPLANRLGFYKIKIELENLSFRYRCPKIYEVMVKKIDNDIEDDKVKLKTFTEKIDEILQAHNIKYRHEMAYRSPYSLYRRMMQRKLDFEHLECRHFMRIVFPDDPSVSEKDMCLKIYSLLTSEFCERPGSFINYIDQPKQNGYQSFHIQLLTDKGVWEELHISSERMQKLSRMGCMADRPDEDISAWIENFREVLHDIAHNRLNTENEGAFYIESVRTQFYNDDIMVYTPEGKPMRLPKNSTVLDFAYNIHTSIGHHAKYARVNGKLASVKTILHRGDCVEIGTDPESWPKEDWRGAAKSYRALRFINMYLDRLPKPPYNRCPLCHPIPGEEVIGFTEKDNSVTIHRRDCQEAISQASQYGDSIVAVDFKAVDTVLYPADITIHAVDRQHLLYDIIESISNKLHLSIREIHTVAEDEIVTSKISFFIHSYDELQTILQSISSLGDVDEVSFNNE